MPLACIERHNGAVLENTAMKFTGMSRRGAHHHRGYHRLRSSKQPIGPPAVAFTAADVGYELTVL
jgi:hypothetical protein